MESIQSLHPVRGLVFAAACFLCPAVAILPHAARGSDVAQPAISSDNVQPHIAYLADPERRGRSAAGKIQARDYIVSQMHQMGLHPLFDRAWTQTVPSRKGLDDQEIPAGENIGGFVRGTDPLLKEEWIIINAHYDHLGTRRGKIYPGADDNASGVSMVLEVARRVAASPLRRSVAFVCFDFEESMLWGSRWFIGHTPMDPSQIKLCLTADMIGRSLGGLGLETVFVMGAEHSSVIRAALNELPVPEHLEVAQLGADMVGTRSDYGPFRDQEIPFLFFSTGEHPDYHTPQDTPERIDYDKVGRVSSMVLGLTQHVGNGDEAPVWEAPEFQKMKEARAVHRVTEQLLASEAAGKIELSEVQRFFVTQVHAKTGFMVREQRVSDEERKWVARTAQMLLITVF